MLAALQRIVWFSLRSHRRPTFSVVIATFARDELITPTLESVAQQTRTDYEVLIVSDGPCTSELKKTVRRYGPRFSLHALPERSRSQSGPNNLGWSKAKGKYIAYLGHDDIWHPSHLQNLATAWEDKPTADFVVGGCVCIGPPGTGDDFTWVSGFFDEEDVEAPFIHFFPPSSIAHLRLLPAEVLKWSDPTLTRRPVDAEFLVGAAEKGCVFTPTGKISVFKFVSALRYLSYLFPNNDEQWQMLAMLSKHEVLNDFVSARIAASRDRGGYMVLRIPDLNQFLPGESQQMYEVIRGNVLPDPQRVSGLTRVDLGEDNRGFDWYKTEEYEGKKWWWSGPNHRPRLLLPFCSSGSVSVAISVMTFAAADIQDSLVIYLNGNAVNSKVNPGDHCIQISFITKLNVDKTSVLEFRMNRTAMAREANPDSSDGRWLGLCLLGIDIEPLEDDLLQQSAQTTISG